MKLAVLSNFEICVTISLILFDMNRSSVTTNLTANKNLDLPTPFLWPSQPLEDFSKQASADSLIASLYGLSPDFEYNLVLNSDFTLPLYRDRNFK